MPEVTELNATLGLPPMTFRGLTAPPYDMANYSGGHSQTPKEYPYIPASGHDHTGRTPLKFEFKLYFLNSLESGLFPDLFQQWSDGVIFDGTPGVLAHPTLGDVDVVPTNWDIEFTSQRQSGMIMKVSFEETTLDPEVISTFGFDVNLKEAAAAADEARENLNIAYPDGERSTSLSDSIGQVEGLIFSSRLAVGGMINQVIGTIDGLFDLFDEIEDTTKWALIDIHLQVWSGLKDLAERAGIEVSRALGKHVTRSNTGIDEVASTVGNTVGEIMTLNSSLLGQPEVPEGTTVLFYK